MPVAALRPRALRQAPAAKADPAERIWRRALPAILLVALLARLAIILATPHFSPWGDPADYQRHALSIAYGLGYPATEIATPGTPSAFRPPAYPYLLAGVYAVFGAHLLLGRLLGALLGVLSIALLAHLGRAVWSARVGLVAAGLGAIFLPLVELNATLLSESLFIPLELAFALALAAWARAPCRLRWPLLAGAVCAAAALTRGVAAAWLLPALVIAGTGPGRFGLRARSAAALVAAFVLVLVPWTVRNAQALHAFVPLSTEGGYTLAGQYNREAAGDRALEAVWRDPTRLASLSPVLAPLYGRPGGVNEAQLDGRLRHAGLTYIEHHPGHVVRVVWLDTLRMFDLGTAHAFTTGIAYRELALPHRLWETSTLMAQVLGAAAVIVLVLAAAPAAARRRRPFRLGPWWLWAIPVLTIGLTVVMVGNPRKRVPLDPFLLALVASALVAMLDGWVARRRRWAGGH